MEERPWQLAALVLFVVQAIARADLLPVPGSVEVYLWLLSGLALAAILATQRDALLGLCALGIVLNLLTVAANGGMPFAVPDFWQDGWTEAVRSGVGDFYHPVGSGTWISIVSDVLPTPLPSLVSIGDVVMMVGVVAFLVRELSCRAGAPSLARTIETH